VLNHDGTIREWIGGCIDVDTEKRHAAILAAQRRRAEFIADANDLFVRSLDYEETLRNLARMAVPRLADWCAVDMLQSDGTFRRLAVAHPDPAMVKVAYEMQSRFPENTRSPYGAHEVVRTGRTVWMPEIPGELLEDTSRSPEHTALIRKLMLRSYICAPILIRDRVAGVLTLVNTARSRSFNEADVELAEDLALRAGHAIENARLYQQALQANRAKDEFLATLSHELRTPLTAILGWANLLRISNSDPATIRTATETIEQSAKAQAALIDDLLDISRIVTGKLQLHVGSIDLVPVVEAGISAVRPAADARRIAIDVDAPSSLPMRGDDNRIQQIIWNLMSNAVKFSREGSHIRVSVRREDGQVVIRVSDEGIGIDPALLPHVFERFWQADSSSHRSHSGLGLGLAIVKYLAELHGGTAEAHSEGSARGATFTIRLPIGAAVQAAGAAGDDGDRKRRRVLLVDDDDATREVVSRTLSHYGANVTPAASASEAMSLLERQTFDLVLTDIAMPHNDGYWLLSEIRKTKPQMRVAALTALGHSDDQLASAGFDSFVRKPVEASQLAELLDA
jgi:signal transduction histidine kinase